MIIDPIRITITKVSEIGERVWIINHLGKKPVKGGIPAKDISKMTNRKLNSLEGKFNEFKDEFKYKELFQNKDIKGIEIKIYTKK